MAAMLSQASQDTEPGRHRFRGAWPGGDDAHPATAAAVGLLTARYRGP